MTIVRKKEIEDLTNKLVRMMYAVEDFLDEEANAPDRSEKAVEELDEAVSTFEDLIASLDRATDCGE